MQWSTLTSLQLEAEFFLLVSKVTGSCSQKSYSDGAGNPCDLSRSSSYRTKPEEKKYMLQQAELSYTVVKILFFQRIKVCWKGIFNIPLPWISVYNMLHGTTTDFHMQAFQFKLLHRIFSTNKLLLVHIQGFEQSPVCRFCNNDMTWHELLSLLFQLYPPGALFCSKIQRCLK